MFSASIVIISHNYGRFLRECIESALGQTYPGCQVVVVDDGSTDDSPEIIRSYGSQIEAILKENGGQASALNAGFRRARGDVVLFLDADDLLFPQAMAEIMARWNETFAKAHFRLEIRDGDGKYHASYPHRDFELADGDVTETLLQKGFYVGPPTSGNVYHRRVLEKILPIPEKDFHRASDVYLNTRAVFHGPVLAVDQHLGMYRMHGGNAAFGISFGDDIGKLRRRLTQLQNCRHVLFQEAQRLGRTECAVNWKPDAAEQRINLACLRLDPLREKEVGSRWKCAWELVRSSWSRPGVSMKERASHLAFAMVLAFSPKWFLVRLHAATPAIKRHTRRWSIIRPVS